MGCPYSSQQTPWWGGYSGCRQDDLASTYVVKSRPRAVFAGEQFLLLVAYNQSIQFFFDIFSHRFVVCRFCTSKRSFGYSAMKKPFFILYPKINPLQRIYFRHENKSKSRYDFFLSKKIIVSVSCKQQLTTKSRYDLFFFFSFFGGRQFLRKWTNSPESSRNPHRTMDNHPPPPPVTAPSTTAAAAATVAVSVAAAVAVAVAITVAVAVAVAIAVALTIAVSATIATVIAAAKPSRSRSRRRFLRCCFKLIVICGPRHHCRHRRRRC